VKPHQRAALYVAGTADVDMRRAKLADEARRKHWQVPATYHDTRGTWPELKRLQAAVMADELQTVMVHDVTDLGGGCPGSHRGTTGDGNLQFLCHY
jgi:hypothetical protein